MPLRWIAATSFALCVVLNLSAVGAFAAAPSRTTVVARIAGFSPRTVVVAPGALITWSNRDRATHDATARTRINGRPAFSSGAPAKGAFRARAPRRRGTYGYVCSVHPLTMQGKVVVR